VARRMILFFKEVLMKEVPESQKVVIFVDEIDSTLSLDFTDDFFTAVRAMYLERPREPRFKRLSFVLIGVASPSDLISDLKRTPFNIGQRIDLTDFTFDEALPLAAGFNLPEAKAREVLNWVLGWTGGHPYLTQHLCYAIAKEKRTEWTSEDVDRTVASTFLGIKSDTDSNLVLVREMLTNPKRFDDIEGVLTTYRKVLRGHSPVKDEEQSPVKSHLKLSGVVRRDGGLLLVRNRIYREVFSDAWAGRNTPKNWMKHLVRTAAGLVIVGILISAVLAPYAWAQKRNADNALAAERAAKDEAIKARAQLEDTNKQLSAALASEKIARGIAQEKTEEAESQRKVAEAAAAREGELRQDAVVQRERAEKAEELSFISKLVLRSQSLEEKPDKLSERVIVSRHAYVNATRAESQPGPTPENFGGEIPAPLSVLAYQALMGSAALLPRPIGTAYSADPDTYDFKLDQDGKTLAIFGSSKDKKPFLARWNINTKILSEARSFPELSSMLLYRPDGYYVYRLGGRAKVHFPAGGEVELENSFTIDVRAVDISPAGESVMILSELASSLHLGVWRTSDGRQLTQIEPGEVLGAALSPDGNTAFAVSAKKGIQIWNVQTGGEILAPVIAKYIELSPSTVGSPVGATPQTLPELENIKGALFSEDRSRVVIWNPYTVDVWNLAGPTFRQRVARLTVATPPAGSSNSSDTFDSAPSVLAVSRDGRYVVTRAAERGTAILWSLKEDGSISQRHMKVADTYFRAKFSADGNTLVTASGSNFRVWDVNSGRETFRILHGEEFKAEMELSPDGGYLAMKANSGLSVWRLSADPKPLHRLLSDEEEAVAGWRPNKRYKVFQQAPGNRIQVWDSDIGVAARNVELPERLKGADITPNGSRLVTLMNDDAMSESTLTVWEANGGRINWKHRISSDSVAISDDGKYVAAYAANDMALVWDVSHDKIGLPIQIRVQGKVDVLEFIPKSHSLLSVFNTPTTSEAKNQAPPRQGQLWSLPDGTQLGQTIKAPFKDFDDFCFSPDGKYLAAETLDRNSVVLIETASGKERATFPHPQGINSMALVGRNNIYKLATAGAGDHILRVWQWQGDNEPILINQIANDMSDLFVSLSQDGTYLLSGADDEPIRIWDIRDPGRAPEIARFKPEAGAGFAVFSPNGKYIYTFAGGLLELWRWQPHELLCQVNERLIKKDLTPIEWSYFLYRRETQRFIDSKQYPTPSCSPGP
jgi:WD40 repeat protein